MSVKIKISTPIRRATQGLSELESGGETIRAILNDITSKHPALKSVIFKDSSGLQEFITIYLNQDDIRFLSGLDTPVNKGDSISILQAVAGG